MTASVLTATTAYVPAPVPWHRLLWVAWRKLRATLFASASVIGAVAVLLAIRGHQMRDAYAVVQTCTPAASAACRFATQSFRDNYSDIGPIGALFVWLPALIGAFAGAPLLARELETGTFRYAWTQGVGRLRWLLGLLICGAVGAMALAGAFGMVMTWYLHTLILAGFEQRLHPSLFPSTGLAVVGWALLAFSMGALAGVVIRRVLAALAVTLVVWTGVAFLTAGALRNNYLRPLITSQPDRLRLGDLQVDQWWQHGGMRVSEAQLNEVLRSTGTQVFNGGNVAVAGPSGAGSVDPFQYLTQHGYTQWASYQPDTRYWPFQWIEFGWLTAVSLLLLAGTVWLVRRRPA